MKVVCIRATNVHDYRFPITVGKVYDAVPHKALGTEFIHITNDLGKVDGFAYSWFKPIEDVRDEKLKELGI